MYCDKHFSFRVLGVFDYVPIQEISLIVRRFAYFYPFYLKIICLHDKLSKRYYCFR
jgi:hypothetical protein